ncbi:acyltransferase family protein [Xanthobacter aminoxidans]|uniref:acyltransferase family protein n=1 Tax=Xanthobacter aminoxidans TaxID=186280 RepID=UPI002022F4DE|nr:acyltransferase [Xanthobacter aminoxidans]MCL8381184.1 acyltransferase [Xanthobacter aminoxidans]
MAETAASRYEALDGLRGIAALMVAIHHMQFNSIFLHVDAIVYGELFVDLFFALSGFVIASAYLEKIDDTRDMKRFLTLRFFRIYPLHIFILALFLLKELARLVAGLSGATLSGTAFTGRTSVELLMATIFLVQAWGPFGKNEWNAPSWSISCEALAYIVFALVVPLKPFRWKWTPWFIVAFSILAYTYVAFTPGGIADATYGLPSLLRGLAGFSTGVLCYQVMTRRSVAAYMQKMSDRTLTAIQFCAVLAFLVVLHYLRGPAIVIAVVPLVFLILSLHLDRGMGCTILNTRVFQYLGKTSYSIYMIHMFILLMTDSVLKRVLGSLTAHVDGATSLAIGTGIALVLAAVVVALADVTYRFIEHPWREYGRGVARRLGRVLKPSAAAE